MPEIKSNNSEKIQQKNSKEYRVIIATCFCSFSLFICFSFASGTAALEYSTFIRSVESWTTRIWEEELIGAELQLLIIMGLEDTLVGALERGDPSTNPSISEESICEKQ